MASDIGNIHREGRVHKARRGSKETKSPKKTRKRRKVGKEAEDRCEVVCLLNNFLLNTVFLTRETDLKGICNVHE